MRRGFTTRLVAVLGLYLLSLPAFAVPPIQNWTTANGARVYFVPAPELPMVNVQIVFDAGSARDGARPGLAQLTNDLLESGTADLSADAVAERLDSVGADLSSGALRDMAWLSLRSLVEPRYLDPAVATVARLLREPAFAPDALERERQRMLVALQERAQSPAAIASKTFYEALYGKYPYASPPEGTEDSLKALTRDEVQSFHRRYYVGANAVVAIVGALDRAAAERLANTLVGGLPSGEAAPPLPPAPPLNEAKTIRIPYPSTQSHVFIGQLGISRTDPDYYSLYLGNHVLGGNGLVSTLAEEVREKQGFAYSVYSTFAPMRQAGPFMVNLQTRTDQTEAAVKLVQSTLQTFVAEGPPATELQMARQNITGGFALRIDSNADLVQVLASIGFYQLPLDYLQTYTARIDALTLEQVRQAFQRHLHPDKLLTVIVGGAS
ncbi:MAG: pitrilysin family protein [Candidatus Competibacteraceae bacterium]